MVLRYKDKFQLF